MAVHELRFDGRSLHAAMDRRRQDDGLTWVAVARELEDLSAELNARRPGHPVAASTVANLGRTGHCTCQHGLVYLRWLDRAPEDFLAGPVADVGDTRLPACGPDRRLRWALKLTWACLDERRREDGLTWTALARVIGCSPAQLTVLRTARYAMDMELALRSAQWLGRPAADFTYPAEW